MSEENFRRAEDDPRWKSYVSDEINWTKAFETLGGSFTTRILLRREKFSIIKEWLDSPECGEEKDLDRILADCWVTLESLELKEAPAEKIADLKEIVDRLSKKIDS